MAPRTSMRSPRRKRRRVYHYTSRAALDRILETGVIKPSRNAVTDAMMGAGVYLTPLRPNSKDSTLSQNNYDGSRIGRSDPRTEVYIGFWEHELDHLKCTDPRGRRVCVVPRPIIIDEYDYITGSRARFGREEEEEEEAPLERRRQQRRRR